MNYIDEIAKRIYDTAGAENHPRDDPWDDCECPDLYRAYAVLALAKGDKTTCADVHNAWSAWRIATMPHHDSIIPFDQLRPDVKGLDQPYVDAIHRVARELRRAVAV